MTQLGPEFAALMPGGRNAPAGTANTVLFKPASPTSGMSTMDKLLAGTGQGMEDIVRHAGNLVGLESNRDLTQAKSYDAPLMSTTPGKIGSFVGSTAILAPLGMGAEAGLGRLGAMGARLAANPITSGMAQGAAQGFLTADPGQRTLGTLAGGVTGGVLPGLGGAVGKIARGITRTPEAQALLDRGIDLTGGQMNPKGILNRMEQASEGALGIGDVIQNAREGAMRQYNRAMVEDAMAPGAKLKSDSGDFNDLIDEAAKSFEPAYDAGKGFPVGAKIMRTGSDIPLRDAIQSVVVKPRIGLSAADRKSWGQQLSDQLNEVVQAGRKQGGLKSDDLLAFRSSIRDAIRGEAGDTNASRAAKGLLSDVEDRVTQALESQLPPDAAQALRDTDRQYARFAIVRNAAKSAGDRPGGPTPFEMSRAIAKGTEGNTYARGGGLGRDLSKAARETFQSNVPRTGLSGIGRLLPFLAAGAGALHHPLALAPLAGLGALDLTQGGRRVLAGNTGVQKALQGGLMGLQNALPSQAQNLLPLYARSGLLSLAAPRLQQMPSQ